MGQGEFFVLTGEQAMNLQCSKREGRLDALDQAVFAIEDGWPEDRRLPVWKNWTLLHCCLSDGTFNPRGGSYPLNHAILGGQHLYQADAGYTGVVVTPEQVRDVSTALDTVQDSWLPERFRDLFGEEYKGGIPTEDLEALTELLVGIRTFYRNAARDGHAVLFTTDERVADLYREGV
jgi:hypothetical protein